jgi:hypothetical protein
VGRARRKAKGDLVDFALRDFVARVWGLPDERVLEFKLEVVA